MPIGSMDVELFIFVAVIALVCVWIIFPNTDPVTVWRAKQALKKAEEKRRKAHLSHRPQALFICPPCPQPLTTNQNQPKNKKED